MSAAINTGACADDRAVRSGGVAPIRISCAFSAPQNHSGPQPRSDHHGQHASCVCVRCYLRSIRRDVRRPSDVPVFSISRRTVSAAPTASSVILVAQPMRAIARQTGADHRDDTLASAETQLAKAKAILEGEVT